MFSDPSMAAVQAIWARMGVSPSILMGMAAVNGAFSLICGVGILRGARWARGLYVAGSITSLLVGAALLRQGWSSTALGVLVLGIFVVLLTRPSSNAYFNGTYTVDEADLDLRRRLSEVRARQQAPGAARRVFGRLGILGSGAWLGLAWMIIGFDPGVGVFLAVQGAIGLGIGTALWGPRRWAAVAGWAMLVAGAMGSLVNLSVALLTSSPMWETMREAGMSGADVSVPMLWAAAAINTVVALLGAYLARQAHLDDVEEASRLYTRESDAIGTQTAAPTA